MFADWVNRRQADVIDYLREENRLLKERLDNQRIRITDAERRHRRGVLATSVRSRPTPLRTR